MTATSGNHPSRKELFALGTAITFAYVGAYVSAFLAFSYAVQNPLFEVFWWIGGVCWFLTLVLPARLGHLLAKRQGWYGVIGTLLAVIPWLVLSGLATLYVVMLAASLE
jgi:hypothetical protein